MAQDDRTFMEKLVAQWPGLLGFILIGVGLLIIREIHQGGRNANSRAGIGFIVAGIIMLGKWAFSSPSNSNF